MAILRSLQEPLLFTTSGDCMHDCLFDFSQPAKPMEPDEWIKSIRMVTQIASISKWLKYKGIDLILVPVPRVLELYPQRFLGEGVPRSGEIAPHLRYLTLQLLLADVEVFDLLPQLRHRTSKGNPPLNLATDAHWTDVAQRITARLIAARLARFGFAQSAKRAPTRYSFRPAEFRFGGYFYEFLTDAEIQLTRATMTQSIEEVFTADGKPFEANAGAPLMVVGDSFTSFHHVALGREQSGEAAALRKAGDPFAEFKLPPGSGIVAYLAKELNCKISHKAVLGSTLEPLIDLFREPEDLNGVQSIVWIVNTMSLFRQDAYPKTLKTPPVKAI